MQTAGFSARDLNDGLVVAINIEAKPGEADAVARILEDLIAPTMAEAGTKLFLPYRSPGDPGHFFIFELYGNEDGWAEHQATAQFKAAIAELLPRVARRKRVPFVPFATI
jgi:quinol monooxygenase YgiN